jgi:hypothetical protein
VRGYGLTIETPHPPSMLRIEGDLSHKGRGEEEPRSSIQTPAYGAMEIGEKSTNQLFGCTKPLTLGLMARGETSWAT